jgi:hypothetical protein
LSDCAFFGHEWLLLADKGQLLLLGLELVTTSVEWHYINAFINNEIKPLFFHEFMNVFLSDHKRLTLL